MITLIALWLECEYSKNNWEDIYMGTILIDFVLIICITIISYNGICTGVTCG